MRKRKSHNLHGGSAGKGGGLAYGNNQGPRLKKHKIRKRRNMVRNISGGRA